MSDDRRRTEESLDTDTVREGDVYAEEQEYIGEMDRLEGVAGTPDTPDDYPDDTYPENMSEDDLEDTSTEYTEAEFHDEQRTGEKLVNDIDLGEALYYERDNDVHHMDGPIDEDERLDEDDDEAREGAYSESDPDLEEHLVRESIEENEEA